MIFIQMHLLIFFKFSNKSVTKSSIIYYSIYFELALFSYFCFYL